MGLRAFNLWDHQPPPPGYPFFIFWMTHQRNFGNESEDFGCVFVSGPDSAIVTLVTRSTLRQTLVEEIELRHFKISHEYAIEICEALKAVAHSQSLQTL